MELHLAVRFPGLCQVLDFRADRAAALAFAADARRIGSQAVITVDAAVSADMPLLPCQRLFQP
ncbi:hypothetical protein ACIGO9_20370 [Nocardia asteroides]|uniref:hypothetical protein n=1 Tax=Nocardia asteroides TaxID=1824 RepID=UPI0037C4F122